MTLINHIERGPVWNKKGPRRPPMLYSGPKGGAKDPELDKEGPLSRPVKDGPMSAGPTYGNPKPLPINGGRGTRDRTGPKWDKDPRPGGKGPNDGGPEVLLKGPDPRPV